MLFDCLGTLGAAGMGLDTDASNKLVDRVETGSHNW